MIRYRTRDICVLSAEFVDLLRGSGIDMRALSLAEAADFGVLRMRPGGPMRFHLR